VVLGVRGVGPGAGGVDGEGAVAADGGGLRHEAGRAVDVADGERAGGGNVTCRVGLGQVADGRGEQRRVVGAEDVDGDGRGSAVGAGDREGVGVGGAVLELVVLGVRGVGPGACAIDGEGAVAADGAGLRHEAGGAVDVADGKHAGGGDVACRVGLGQVADVGGEHRGVVGAEDVDGDGRGSAVGAGDREGVGVGGAVLELVVLGVRGVGPGAGAIDGEGAVAADGAGLRHEAGGAVGLGDGERAGGGDVTCRVGLGQVADVGGEHRGVVGAEDVDGDGRGSAVGAGDRECVGVGGAGGNLVVKPRATYSSIGCRYRLSSYCWI